MKRKTQYLRQFACMALGALLLMAWFAAPANACGACASTVTTEVSCCSETATPPPCVCEAHHAHPPHRAEMPDCCPCGIQEAPANAAVMAAPVQTVTSGWGLTPPASGSVPFVANEGAASAPVMRYLPNTPPAYLMDCALLR